MTIFQKPNLPLLAAAIGLGLSKLTPGLFHRIGATAFTIAIIIWSYEEATTGVNWLRKSIGVIVLAFIAYSLFIQLK